MVECPSNNCTDMADTRMKNISEQIYIAPLPEVTEMEYPKTLTELVFRNEADARKKLLSAVDGSGMCFKKQTLNHRTGLTIPSRNGNFDPFQLASKRGLCLGRRKLSAGDPTLPYCFTSSRSLSFGGKEMLPFPASSALSLPATAADVCHSTWSNKGCCTSVSYRPNVPNQNKIPTILSRDSFRPQITVVSKSSSKGILKSILLDTNNVPEIYRSRSLELSIPGSTENMEDGSYERRRLYSYPFCNSTLEREPTIARLDSPANVDSSEEPLCLSLKKRKMSVEMEDDFEMGNNDIHTKQGYVEEVDSTRDRKFSFSIMYSLLTQSDMDSPNEVDMTVHDSKQQPTYVCRGNGRKMSENVTSETKCFFKSAIDAGGRRRAATWSQTGNAIPEAQKQRSEIKNDTATRPRDMFKHTDAGRVPDNVALSSCDDRHKRVAIVKAMEPVIREKMSKWVTQMTALVRELRKIHRSF